MFLWTKKSFSPKICVQWIKVGGQKTLNIRYGPFMTNSLQLSNYLFVRDDEVDGLVYDDGYKCEDEGFVNEEEGPDAHP